VHNRLRRMFVVQLAGDSYWTLSGTLAQVRPTGRPANSLPIKACPTQVLLCDTAADAATDRVGSSADSHPQLHRPKWFPDRVAKPMSWVLADTMMANESPHDQYSTDPNRNALTILREHRVPRTRDLHPRREGQHTASDSDKHGTAAFVLVHDLGDRRRSSR
jgi:hypothetical protein